MAGRPNGGQHLTIRLMVMLAAQVRLRLKCVAGTYAKKNRNGTGIEVRFLIEIASRSVQGASAANKAIKHSYSKSDAARGKCKYPKAYTRPLCI